MKTEIIFILALSLGTAIMILLLVTKLWNELANSLGGVL